MNTTNNILNFDEINGSAKTYWRRQKKLFDKTSKSSGDNHHGITNRYLMLDRLVNESTQLNNYWAKKEKEQILYVIDPHIFATYARYWEKTNYSGFSFLETEWEEKYEQILSSTTEDKTKRNFFAISLFESIFEYRNENTSPFIGLPCQRDIILNHYNYFSNNIEDNKNSLEEFLSDNFRDKKFGSIQRKFSKSIIDNAQNFLSECNTVLNHSLTAKEPWLQLNKLSESLSTSAATYLEDAYSANRLSQIISKASLSNLVDTLNKLFKIKSDNELQNILSTNSNQNFKDNLNVLIKLQETFIRESNPVRSGEAEYTSRVANRSHLETITNIHLINSYFNDKNINIRLKYLTFSNYLSNFLYPLKNLNVQLIHPRFFHQYHTINSKDEDAIDIVSQVRCIISAAKRSIESDDKVENDELEKIEKYLQKPVSAMRSFSDLKSNWSKYPVPSLIKNIKTSIESLEESVQKYDEDGLITQQVKNFKDDITLFIKKHFSDSNANFYTDKLKSGLVEFRDSATNTNIEDNPNKNNVLLQSFSNLIESLNKFSNHNDNSDESYFLLRPVKGGKNILRYVCLPLSGGFRHTFSIVNSEAIRILEKIKNKQAQQKEELLEQLKNNSSDSPIILDRYERNMGDFILSTSELFNFIFKQFKENLSNDHQSNQIVIEKNVAFLFFLIALHSCSNSDWQMAKRYIDKAIELIPNNSSDCDSKIKVNLFLLSFECHYLKQMIYRALAESATSFNVKESYFINAKNSLIKACECLKLADDVENDAEFVGNDKQIEDIHIKGLVPSGSFRCLHSTRVPLTISALNLEFLVFIRHVGKSNEHLMKDIFVRFFEISYPNNQQKDDDVDKHNLPFLWEHEDSEFCLKSVTTDKEKTKKNKTSLISSKDDVIYFIRDLCISTYTFFNSYTALIRSLYTTDGSDNAKAYGEINGEHPDNKERSYWAFRGLRAEQLRQSYVSMSNIGMIESFRANLVDIDSHEQNDTKFLHDKSRQIEHLFEKYSNSVLNIRTSHNIYRSLSNKDQVNPDIVFNTSRKTHLYYTAILTNEIRIRERLDNIKSLLGIKNKRAQDIKLNEISLDNFQIDILESDLTSILYRLRKIRRYENGLSALGMPMRHVQRIKSDLRLMIYGKPHFKDNKPSDEISLYKCLKGADNLPKYNQEICNETINRIIDFLSI